jgi:hypothetical protein
MSTVSLAASPIQIGQRAALVEATDAPRFLDYFRVPFQVTGPAAAPASLPERHPARGWTWLTADRRAFVAWPRSAAGAAGEHWLGDIPIFAPVVPDAAIEGWLGQVGVGWRRVAELTDARGQRVASVWRDAAGTTVLPFDPDQAIESCWSERYRAAPGSRLSSAARDLARRAYYRLRPLMPRSTQIALRRMCAPLQARQRFPRWPVETGLHDLYDFLLDTVAEVAGQPLPYLAPWPNGYRWALLLTHDVELALGCANVAPLRAVEEELGYRSAWNFVPRRYDTPDDLVRDLVASGFEVGVHGLYHDGLDLESEATLRKRLPAMRDYARRWGAVGFRSPALNRRWDVMPRLGFDYDSSYPDSDPHGPQGGGCCTWLPYFNGQMVELPVTMPQDHTVFEILGQSDETLWVEKAAFLKARGGLANLIVHPDYMLEPGRLDAYRRFLAGVADDRTVWRGLPRDVSAWWRRRDGSRLERVHGRWRVAGPASGEAVVSFAGRSAALAAAA